MPATVRIVTCVLAALVPAAAYEITYELADDRYSLGLPGVLLGARLLVPFVAVPSLTVLLVAQQLFTGAAVLVVMTVTAVWAGHFVATDDSSTAALAVLAVPFVALPLAVAVWLGQTVVGRWAQRGMPSSSTDLADAEPSDRLAALTIDALLLGAVLYAPLRELSHAGYEVVAAVLGIIVATVALAVPTARRGQTVGHWLLGSMVVDHRTGGRVPLARAVGRTLLVVVEVAAAWLLIPIAVPDLLVALATGRSLTDRAFGTAVLARS